MLTKIDILSMKPGQQLNEFVAMYVFGRDKLPSGNMWNGADGYDMPDYSNDITSAWMVVEQMISKGYFYRMGDGLRRDKVVNVQDCMFTNGVVNEQVWGSSAPDVICRAALLAVFQSQEQAP